MVNTNQHAALRAFLSGENKTIEDVADACELTERTIYNYLADPEFKAELNQRQGAITAQATLRLANLADEAVSALADVMRNPNQDGATSKRLAAKDMLTLLDTFTDREIIERIESLERAVFR